tara:strand:- start:40 stop:1038 length:999 start_codon:yes stop_codon:yes gene_type:complete
MPYLGNEPGAITDAFTQTFTGDGSTTAFTLSQSSTTNAVFVRISGVMQRNGTDFTVSGTTLAFTTAPPALSNNIVVQFFTVGSIQTIADDAVATAKIADSAVSTAKIADVAVSTAKIADNAISLAKLAGGTDGNLITFDASGDPAFVATGSSGQLLTSAGAGAPPTFTTVSAGFTHATPQAGSGTSLTFGSIPTGTSFIVVTMHDFSSSGGDEWMVQIGDSGGIETADYRSQRSTATNGSLGSDGTPNSNESQGFGITVDAAGNAFGGQMILSLHHPTNHTWTSSSSFRRDGFDHSWGAGSKDLSAELTQVRITTKGGSESFDAGTINIMYM